MNKTEWIDASVYPARPGWYEYKDALTGRTMMLKWRGPTYRWGPGTGLHIKGDKWRGLTKDGYIKSGGRA